MGLFGKPPGATNVAASGKTAGAPANAKPGTQHHAPESPKKLTGKSAAKANSGEGGKAYGSPTVMHGVSGTGFDPGAADARGGDRWSYGTSTGSGQSGEWQSGWHEGGESNVWRREEWDANKERGNGW